MTKTRSSAAADFTKRCKCLLHEIWTQDDNKCTATINIAKNKKFPKNVINNLCNNNLLHWHAGYLCMVSYLKGLIEFEHTVN